MLIIFTGSETIHKKYIGRQILASFNTHVVDGYTVNFQKEIFEVYDSENNLVYKPNSEIVSMYLKEDGFLDEEKSATVDKIIQLQNDMRQNANDNHFAAVFSAPMQDLGLTERDIFADDYDRNYIQPHTYKDVLANYQNRIGDVHLITGVFSKAFIEKIRTDLGSENVVVINLLRNPSIAYLLDPKPDEYYVEHPARTPLMDRMKLYKSFLNSVAVKDIPGIINLRFEDVLRDGQFEINGTVVKLPDEHQNFNNKITLFEKESVVPLNKVSADQLSQFNSFLSNFELTMILEDTSQEALNGLNARFNTNFQKAELEANLRTTFDGFACIKSMLPIYNLIKGTNFTVEQLDSTVPSNLFTALGYEMLNYNDIVN